MSNDALQDKLVLIVDDNAHMRTMLRGMLATVGFREILTAEDGRHALDIHDHLRLDVIVTDLIMPEMDGFELCRRIRNPKRAATAQVPIIVVSGFADRRTVVRARDVGATEFVCKPLSIETLSTRVLSALERPRPFVRDRSFYGPDRRRNRKSAYRGPERRSGRQRIIINDGPPPMLNQTEVDAILAEQERPRL